MSNCGKAARDYFLATRHLPIKLNQYEVSGCAGAFTIVGAFKEIVMSSTRILDRLGSAALTIALVSTLLLFVPGLVRADAVNIDNCSDAF